MCLIVDKSLKRRVGYLEDLFSLSAGDAAGGVDFDLTLRFPDHITL